jgi:hypothetical protein
MLVDAWKYRHLEPIEASDDLKIISSGGRRLSISTNGAAGMLSKQASGLTPTGRNAMPLRYTPSIRNVPSTRRVSIMRAESNRQIDLELKTLRKNNSIRLNRGGSQTPDARMMRGGSGSRLSIKSSDPKRRKSVSEIDVKIKDNWKRSERVSLPPLMKNTTPIPIRHFSDRGISFEGSQQCKPSPPLSGSRSPEIRRDASLPKISPGSKPSLSHSPAAQPDLPPRKSALSRLFQRLSDSKLNIDIGDLNEPEEEQKKVDESRDASDHDQNDVEAKQDLGAKRVFEYDESGQLVEVTGESATEQKDNYDYDEELVEVVYEDGESVTSLDSAALDLLFMEASPSVPSHITWM